MPKWLGPIVSSVLVAYFAASSSTAADLSQARAPQWSIDLTSYGFHQGKKGSEHDISSRVEVAATQSVVAVAIQNQSSAAAATVKPHGFSNSRWDVSLLFFDVKTGNLQAKAGPWTAGFWYELFPTAQGNFVLHLWNAPDSEPAEKKSESLVLVSSYGKELEEVDLARIAPVRGHPEYREWRVLSSPSRRTLLLCQPGPNGHHYEIIDADTLRTTIEWNDTGKEPVIVAISDKNMLGENPLASSPNSSESSGKEILTVRAADGVWKPFLAPGTSWQFLSDDVLVSLQEVGQPGRAETNSYRFIVTRIDGSSVLTKEIQERYQHFYASTPMQTSPDGRHVAAVISYQSVWWLWRELDMGPDNSTLYVWAVPNAEPVLRIKLRNLFAKYSLSPDGSWIVVADENTLRVIPVSSKSSISKNQ